MNFTYLVIFFITSLYVSCDALKCFVCKDCGDLNYGEPTQCEVGLTRCRKEITGYRIDRDCGNKDGCYDALEKTILYFWRYVKSLITESSEPLPSVYCCNHDYCNAATLTKPGPHLLFICLIVLVGFVRIRDNIFQDFLWC